MVGSSVSSAWCTLAHALSLLHAGDRDSDRFAKSFITSSSELLTLRNRSHLAFFQLMMVNWIHIHVAYSDISFERLFCTWCASAHALSLLHVVWPIYAALCSLANALSRFCAWCRRATLLRCAHRHRLTRSLFRTWFVELFGCMMFVERLYMV